MRGVELVPCWGERTTSPPPAMRPARSTRRRSPRPTPTGWDPVSPRTFGEASIDFDVLGGEGCVAFGSAYLKSRSSDSFTAALKDFIAPTATGLNNCGALKIVKTKKHAADGPGDHPHAGVVFSVTGGRASRPGPPPRRTPSASRASPGSRPAATP